MDINIYQDFLSPEELTFLTGKKYKSKIIEQLNKQGIPFVLNAANQPIVRRDYHIKRRSSRSQDEPKPEWVPNAMKH